MYLLWKGFVSVVCFCLFSSLTHQKCINSKGISSRGYYYKAFSISTVLPCFTDTDKSFSIDQRGEQTINRDAKTTGGIKAFSVTKESVLKSIRRNKNTKDLREMCGFVSVPGISKPSHPSQLSKSEHLVQNVMHVLVEEYIQNHLVLMLGKTNLLV
jgi:hypothetical protein